MHHGLVVLEQMEDKGWLHGLQEAGHIRASMNVEDGPNEGIGVLYGAGLGGRRGHVPLCPPGALCGHHYAMLNILPFKVTSIGEPRFLAMLLQRIDLDQRSTWAQQVQRLEAAAPSGTKLAAAHLFGKGGYNAVVEVVAEEHDSLLRSVLACTELPGVRAADVHLVDPADTRGLGQGLPADRA